VITVIDPEAARRLLAAGRLACPGDGCTGSLRVWTRARPRPVRGLDGQVQVIRPDRGRCRVCTRSHVLLPVVCLPRRGYRVEVIGAALLAAADGAGHARAAAACGAPVSTVRDWIRAVTRGAATLTAHAAQVAQSIGDTGGLRTPSAQPVTPRTAVLTALGGAARGLAGFLTEPGPTTGGRLTGVDYLDLIRRAHRRDIARSLRLADPHAAPHATPWQMVAVLTAGQLLTRITRTG